MQQKCSPTNSSTRDELKKAGVSFDEDRIVRDAECEQISGLSRATRWRLERINKFPKRIQLAPNCVGWRYSSLMMWIRQRAGEDAA